MYFAQEVYLMKKKPTKTKHNREYWLMRLAAIRLRSDRKHRESIPETTTLDDEHDMDTSTMSTIVVVAK
jgi:hypothetical protein